ncbi:MAG: hypothetical protein KKD44_07915 [Proteobacteria bacterium]|nr:hypothetical protein [Pseudomonadota bacterium]
MNKPDFNELCIMHFGSEEAMISSKVLGEALISLSTIIDEINETLLTGKNVSIQIKPFEKGSFEVPFELIEFAIVGLLSTPSVSSIPEILKVLKEFVDIKIRLKGTQPKEIERDGKKTTLTTESGDIINISSVTGNLIINNYAINQAFDKSVGNLSEDKSIKEFSILKNNREPICKIEEKEFGYFSSNDSLPILQHIQPKEKKNTVSVSLSIHKVVFDMTSKWGFIYKGNKISARITDENFKTKAQTEGRFGKGDILDVLMDIYQEFDESVGVYINKSYMITEVFKHIPRLKQLEFL